MARFHTDDTLGRRPLYWFTVTGRGIFPMDMLRHDLAWPASGEDAAKIVGHDFGYDPDDAPRDRRSIRMGCAKFGGPTIARWSSFGWSVGDEARGEVG